MSNEDEEKDDSAPIGVGRYPCMPSLVALQQMRNRLHLAYLGKKLMKWTAMATSKELRKISEDIQESYKNFPEDTTEGFILLARARYFYPNLNRMVLENPEEKAAITVGTAQKSITGVTILTFGVQESDVDHYEHLGIDKGGQIIKEVKQMWRNLLKRMVFILQLRQSFMTVELAKTSATKKKNVLGKIVIPRTQATIKYIILELEEMAREELYRIKKIVQVKLKKKENLKQAKNVKVSGAVCSVALKLVEDKFPRVKQLAAEVAPCPKPEIICEPKLVEEMQIPIVVEREPPRLIIGIEPQYVLVPPQESLQIEIKLRRIPKNEVKVSPSTESNLSSRTITGHDPCSVCQPPNDDDNTMDYLKRQLTEVISQSKLFMDRQLSKIDFSKFLRSCEDLRSRMEKYFAEKKKNITDSLMELSLDNLNTRLREVVQESRKLKEKGVTLSPSLEDFLKTCEEAESKINICSRSQEQMSPQSRLREWKNLISEVESLTKAYKGQSQMTPAVQEFLESCKNIKMRIDSYSIPKHRPEDVEKKKIDYLKQQVSNVQELAELKADGMSSTSVDTFVTACKDFKKKLSEYIEQDKEITTNQSVNRLITQIDEAISLSKEAKMKGYVSESVEDFIKSCENIKRRLQERDKERKKKATKKIQPPILKELKNNINDVMDLASKLKAEGISSESVDKFVKSCETTKEKIELNEMFPPCDDDVPERMIYPICGKSCTCEGEDNSPTPDAACTRCEDIMNDEEISSIRLRPLPPICDTCSRVSDKDSVKEPSQEFPCATGAGVPEAEPEIPLGLYEQKIRKIVKITRTLNDDGTVREEKEIITVKEESHDPNQTRLYDVDRQSGTSRGISSLQSSSNRTIGLCVVPDLCRGFMPPFRNVKSEIILKTSGLTEPLLPTQIRKSCII